MGKFAYLVFCLCTYLWCVVSFLPSQFHTQHSSFQVPQSLAQSEQPWAPPLQGQAIWRLHNFRLFWPPRLPFALSARKIFSSLFLVRYSWTPFSLLDVIFISGWPNSSDSSTERQSRRSRDSRPRVSGYAPNPQIPKRPRRNYIRCHFCPQVSMTIIDYKFTIPKTKFIYIHVDRRDNLTTAILASILASKHHLTI